MLFNSSLLLVLSVVASVSALTTPHAPRNHHHRAIAHRAASPNSPHVSPTTIRRRADGKRCKARPVSSSAPVANAAPSPTKETAPTSKPHSTTTKEQPQEPVTTSRPPKPSPTPPPPPPPQPKPTTEKPPATTKAPSSGGGGGPSFMVGTQTGQGTFYDTGLGACGIVNQDTDYIAAVSHLLFDHFPGYNGANPNNNPICGKKVRVTYEGKSVTVAITDRCEGCAVTDLDFSPSAFNALAAFSVGRISNMNWVWV